MEKIKLAIADDNRELAQLMCDYLNSQPNMEVAAVAHNGKSCIETLKKEKVEILLLDNIMPYMDGIAVLDAINSDSELNNIKVIMLSAFGQDSLMSQAARNGASYFIMKPFELERLVHQINHIAQTDALAEDWEKDVKPDDPITAIVKDIGIPPHINGYCYLKEAVSLVMERPEMLQKVTKSLYPGIAQKFDTTPARVERSIRHAIESLWNRGEIEHISGIFGYSEDYLKSKPTNSEFIAMIRDSIDMEE